jgi:hypothetical protein
MTDTPSQAARVHAAGIYSYFNPHSQGAGEGAIDGHFDDREVVQAFHRFEQAIRADEREKIAAGMREYAAEFGHGEKVWPREFAENALAYATKGQGDAD